MKKAIITAAIILLSACTDAPEPLDPTGLWDMTGTWGFGSCNATGTFTQKVTVVTDRRGDYYATTGVATETASGVIAADETSARIDLTIINTNVTGDGTTQASVTIKATASDELDIRGSGRVTLSGGRVCTQPFTLVGALR